MGLTATGFVCPPMADKFIYGFTPVELRQEIKNIQTSIYDCVETEDAIKWSSYLIEQKCKKGKISPKIVRAIMLEKD